jgi:GTPase SAR1 family protein
MFRGSVCPTNFQIDEEAKRAVTTQEASDFAKENGLLYIETSAKTNKNVEDAFLECSRGMIA